MEPIALTKVVPIALKVVFHLCAGAAPYILNREIAEKIQPQIDKIQSAIEDLKIKDLKIAKSLFEDALLELGQKFEEYSTTSVEHLKDHSEVIKAALSKAQDSALAANHSGLPIKDRITASKWILATELLGVLNEATSKSKLDPDDLEWIQKRMRLSKQKCNKYLKEVNQISEITDFIASKITADGSWDWVWRQDQTESVCQLLDLNLQISQFFHFMENMYKGVSVNKEAGNNDVNNYGNANANSDGNGKEDDNGEGNNESNCTETGGGVLSIFAGLSAKCLLGVANLELKINDRGLEPEVTSTSLELGSNGNIDSTGTGMDVRSSCAVLPVEYLASAPNLKTNSRELGPELAASKLLGPDQGRTEGQEPLLNEASPMEIAIRLFEKTGDKCYGDIVHKFQALQILKQIHDPFCQFLQSKNSEVLTAIFTCLSNMEPELRCQTMSIMEEQYPNKVFIQTIVSNQVLEPFCEYKETENTEILLEVIRRLITMWPEIRSDTMSIIHEKYPGKEFHHAIVENQVLPPFRDYLESKIIHPDILPMKVFLGLSKLPELRAETVSIMEEKYPDREFLEALVVCLNSETFFPRDPKVSDEAISISEEAKCRWIEEAGLQDVTSLTNGGSTTASSTRRSSKPGGAFVSASGETESWQSYGNPNEKVEFLERELTSAVTPAIFAVQNWWKGTAPQKFKVIARGDEETGWELLVDANGVAWENMQWKFWVIRKKKSVRAFRMVVEEVQGSYVMIRNVGLYC